MTTIRKLFRGFLVEVRDDVFGARFGGEVVVLATEKEGRGFGVCGFCRKDRTEIVREICSLISPSLSSSFSSSSASPAGGEF